MYRYVLYLILTGCSLTAHAQFHLSDSLYKALPDSVKPKKKLAVTDKEAFTIVLNSSQAFVQKHYAEIETWTHRLEKEVETIPSNEEKIPYAQAIAGFYLQAGKITDAFNWNKKLVAWGAGAHVHRAAISNAYLNLSIYYSTKLRQDSAVNMLHQAQDIAIADHDSTSIRDIYYLYMSIYANLFLYHQALTYLNKYLHALPSEAKWKDTYTNTVLTKAAIYARLYNTERKMAYADSTIGIINTVLARKKGEASIWYHTCYSTLGYLYYFQKDYQKAVTYYNLSLLPAYNQAGASVAELKYRAELYRNICLILLGQGNAIRVSLASPIPPKDFTTLRALNEAIYYYYAKRNDYKQALHYFTQYKLYNDSLDIIGQRGKVFEAEQKYSVAQKEAAIVVLENKNLQAQASRNRLLLIGTVIVLLFALLAIVALLLYLRNRRQLAQRLVERQKLADELHSMEQEMELQRLQQQAETEAAIAGQRKEISKNMHDEVSSSLVALRYRVAHMKKTNPDDVFRRVLDGIEDELNVIYLQTRDLLHRMANMTQKKEYNVFELLENLHLRFNNTSELQILVQADNTLRNEMTPQQNTELYRVVKEAVANAMKHSGANRVDINIYKQEQSIGFSIKDNGIGAPVDVQNGLGMVTMKHRLESLNGKLWVESSATGVSVKGSFPME